LLELAENRFAARLNIGEVLFSGKKESNYKQQKYEAKPNLGTVTDLYQINSRRFYECSIRSLEKCAFY